MVENFIIYSLKYFRKKKYFGPKSRLASLYKFGSGCKIFRPYKSKSNKKLVSISESN